MRIVTQPMTKEEIIEAAAKDGRLKAVVKVLFNEILCNDIGEFNDLVERKILPVGSNFKCGRSYRVVGSEPVDGEHCGYVLVEVDAEVEVFE